MLTLSPTHPPDAPSEFSWYFANSEDAEIFHAANSREDAISQGADFFGGDPFYICEARRTPLLDDFFRADRVLEEFEEHNEDAWGEDGPECRTDKKAEQELEAALTETFAAWRAKHKPYTAWMLTDWRNGEEITSEIES